MANRRALNEADLDVVRLLLSEGKPMTEVAARLQVSYKTVQNARLQLGVTVERRRARPSYPPELRAEVVRRYVGGESTGEIARDVGVSDTWVQAQLRAAAVRPRPNGKLAGRNQEIADRYRAGESSAQIAAGLGVADTAVLGHLRGVPRRQAGWAARQVPIRHEAFADIADPAAAYWAGFLMADGCVSDNGRITLVLQERDHTHVQALLDFLGSSGTRIRPQPPGRNRTHGAVRAQVSSRQIAADLGRHGIVPRKTLAGVAASPDLATHPAFWRGMIDGDGTVMRARGKHGPLLSLCGSQVVMEQFADFLARAIPGFSRPNVLEHSSSLVIRIVQVHGVRARKVVEHLWAHVDLGADPLARDGFSPHPCLERKVSLVKAAMAWQTHTEQHAQ